jgi:hypothetical protein
MLNAIFVSSLTADEFGVPQIFYDLYENSRTTFVSKAVTARKHVVRLRADRDYSSATGFAARISLKLLRY